MGKFVVFACADVEQSGRAEVSKTSVVRHAGSNPVVGGLENSARYIKNKK